MVSQIENEMEYGNARFSKRMKGHFSRIAFCITKNSVKNVIAVLFKNTHVLFCFNSTIDENTDTVHLIEGFVF